MYARSLFGQLIVETKGCLRQLNGVPRQRWNEKRREEDERNQEVDAGREDESV